MGKHFYFIAFVVLVLTMAFVAGGQQRLPQNRDIVNGVVIQIDGNVVIQFDTLFTDETCQQEAYTNVDGCQNMVALIPLDVWKQATAWHFENASSPYDNPVVLDTPKLGQLTKTQFVNGHLIPIEPCNVRTKKIVEGLCSGDYCRHGINSSVPTDCSRPQSKFITELLNKYKGQ